MSCNINRLGDGDEVITMCGMCGGEEQGGRRLVLSVSLLINCVSQLNYLSLWWVVSPSVSQSITVS